MTEPVEAIAGTPLGPNAHLIGRAGSRAQLDTPALVVDLDALEHNIKVMAAFAYARGLALRPHAKTHRCAQISAMQISAGAVGICCAKVGEAEALAAAGVGPILITSPIVAAGALARFARLAGLHGNLAVVVDCPAQLALLVDALAGLCLEVLVDIDPGQHRTGTTSIDATLNLAAAITQQPGLEFGGVQFFSGPTQHLEDYAGRCADMAKRSEYLAATVSTLANAGLPPRIVTGGGTGTHEIDAQLGIMTELQVGSYVFMDDQYRACRLRADDAAPFQTALSIATRVVSANWSALATVDAGTKASTGSPKPPQILAGAPVGSRYEYRGDEHGAIVLPPEAEGLELGSIISLGAPHCDPTANLYDVYHIVRGDTLVDIWPITARGCSS